MGITGICNEVYAIYAVVIGIIAAFFYSFGCLFIYVYKIDDVVESVPIHLFGGVWGTLASGLFNYQFGLFFEHTGWQLLWQVCGMCSMFAWVSFWSILLFLGLRRFNMLSIPDFE